MSVELAVVPVAGLGTRLLPVSLAVPKELLPLGNRPVIHWIADELARAGINRLVLVSSESKRQIANYFSPHSELEERLESNGKTELLSGLWSRSPASGMKVDVVIQQEQLGLGHAVLCTREAVGDQPVVVALGDCVIGLGGRSNVVQQMLQVYESNRAEIVIAFEPVPLEKVSRYGIAKPKASAADPSGQTEPTVFELADVVEKPHPDQAPSRLAIAARYVLGPRIFEALETTRRGAQNEIQLTDAIRALIQQGARAYGVRLPANQRYDVGNLNSYIEAFTRFALSNPELAGVVQKAFADHQSETPVSHSSRQVP